MRDVSMKRQHGILRSPLSLLAGVALAFVALFIVAALPKTSHVSTSSQPGTFEIRYHSSYAGAVTLIWGVDDWRVLPDGERPPGTTVADRMYTPMAARGDAFVLAIPSAPGTTINYLFLVPTNRQGKIINAWDSNDQRNFVSVVTPGAAVDVEATMVMVPGAGAVNTRSFLGGCALFWLLALIVTALILRPMGDLLQAARVSPLALSRSEIRDILFLGAVVLPPLIIFATRLGFYSDDWAFLGLLVTHGGNSIAEHYQSFQNGNTAMRPAQILLMAVLFQLFGLQPLGYHIVNALVLAATDGLLYLVLHRLRFPRALALAITLVYAMLPSYSTISLWMASFQIGLSLLFYFLSLYADLRVVTARGVGVWLWKALAIAALLSSGLSYELTLPLFFLNIGIVWLYVRQTLGAPPALARGSWWAPLLSLNALATVWLFYFKLTATTRIGNKGALLQTLMRATASTLTLGYPYDLYLEGPNIWKALVIHYGAYGGGLPVTAALALRHHSSWPSLILAAIAFLLIFVYLWQMLRRLPGWLPSRRALLGLSGLGVLIFGAGYAIFLTNFNVGYSLAGIHNRTAAAAAIGAAISIIGLLGWACTFVGPRLRELLFAALIAGSCACGLLIHGSIVSDWHTADGVIQQTLASASRAMPDGPMRQTVILEEVCPYIGPAVVFESNWDFRGALSALYHNPDLKADVVTGTTYASDEAVVTRVYEQVNQYPYETLLFFSPERGRVSIPCDAAEGRSRAEEAIAWHKQHCVGGHAGYGAPFLNEFQDLLP